MSTMSDAQQQHLKRFLFLLPKNNEFQFSNLIKFQIRKELFLSCSSHGQYLDLLFPKVFQNADSDDHIKQTLESGLDWSLSNYYKYTLKDLPSEIHNHHAYHQNLACARVFRKGEPIYRCLTCGYDETCALCSTCYNEEFHKDHKVNITICLRENGGVCDCGDPEAWLTEVQCMNSTLEPPPITELPREFTESLAKTIETCLDFVVDIMCHSDLQFEDPNETTTTKIEFNSINSTLDPEKYGFSDLNTVDSASDKFYLMVYNDQIRHYRDAVQRIHLVSRKVKQFAEMVTDRVQTYGKGKVISSKNLNLLIERQKLLSSTGLASCIRNHRDIFREDMCDEMLRWLNDFTESELFKTHNLVKNLFCSVFCRKWNPGLLKFKTKGDPYTYKVGTLDNLRIPKVPNAASTAAQAAAQTAANLPRNQNSGSLPSRPASLSSMRSSSAISLTKSSSAWYFQSSKWDLSEAICEQCNYNLELDEYDPLKSHLGSRFQYLTYLDIRFGKSIRILLRDMYATSLITNLTYKHIISCQYVDIYPTIADMFLMMDREPEFNFMCTLSTQLFTCPSNSTSIVKHGDIARIFATIYGFLTTEEIKSPDNIEITHNISMKSLKNRRWGQIFFDVGYILSRAKDSKFILSSGILPMSCDILALFQGKPSVKREKESHIEFESSDYTSFFHAILAIYQFGESIAQCLTNLKDPDAKTSLAKNAIIYVVGYLLKLEKSGVLEDSAINKDSIESVDESGDVLDQNIVPPELTNARDAKILKELIGGNIIQDFRIDEEKVSFLHPLHSFLSWLIEFASFDSLEELVEVLVFATSSSESPGSGVPASELPNPITAIFDYPIRTIVLMSQIKSGFWVRNGFTIRNQLQLYRNSGLREHGYMRDLFLTQVFINTNTPNLTCFLIFSRWLLMQGWIVDEKGYQRYHTESTVFPRSGFNDGNFPTPTGTTPLSIEDVTGLTRTQDLGDSTMEISRNLSLQETQKKSYTQELPYDQKTLPYILEECVSFFIHILTEDLYLQKYNEMQIKEIRIKNEIIHNLCFEPMNYSKLCLQIPDHITAEKSFEIILDEITTFRPPKSANDIGIYQLKELYFEQVNPYYFNYSTNTKDDAIKFIKKRIHKKTKKPLADIVIEPRTRNSQDLGIYRFIGNFSVSAYFSDFIIKTMKYVMKEGLDKLENLLETLLHLIHLCSKEQFIDITKYGSFYDRFVNVSDFYGCSIAVILYEILNDGDFKEHHSKVRAIFNVFQEKYQNLSEILNDQVRDFDYTILDLNVYSSKDELEAERKKKFVQERKIKLLAKFKKQQSSFLKNFKFDSDVEMDDQDNVDAHSNQESQAPSRGNSKGSEELNENKPEAAANGWIFPEPHCLLCQNTSEDAGPFGIMSYISRSSEFRSVPFDDNYWVLKAFSDSGNLDEEEKQDADRVETDEETANYRAFMHKIKENNVIGPGFANQKYIDSKLISLSCGHGMHFQCYMNFLVTNKNKLNQITRNTPENLDHKEFLCPLCKSINNMFIPILWSHNNRNLTEFLAPNEKVSSNSKDLAHHDDLVDETFNPFASLSSSHIYSKEFYQGFLVAAGHDIEEISIITPQSKEIISPNPASALTLEQQQFRVLLSNMFQTFSFFSFPQVFKADSTYVLVNTIKSTEIALRGVSSNSTLVLNQLSNNSLYNLRILTEFRNTSVLMKIKDWIHLPNRKGDAYTKMLANLHSLSKGAFNLTILEADFFELLVNVLPVKTLGLSFNAILRTCFMGHLLQNLYTLIRELRKKDFYVSPEISVLDVPIIPGLDSRARNAILEIVQQFLPGEQEDPKLREVFQDDSRLGSVLLSMLIKASTPFLRRAAIFAFVQCANVDPNEFLISSSGVELDRLCQFMNIGKISEYLEKLISHEKSYESDVFENFVHYANVSLQAIEHNESKKQLEYPGLIKLVDLPDRLDFFFTKYYYSDKYNNPHNLIEDPAVCLFCGQVVDTQKPAIGCHEGQCTTHFLKECANEVGIFLLPKERSLLLLHKNGGSFQNAPFMDNHGELHGESKKNKPFYLMKSRYDDFIRTSWLQHNIPNFIVRNLDGVLDAGGWETL